MDDDRVARKKLELLPLERLLQIGHRDLVVSPSISTPLSAATSSITPRAKNVGAFCTPSLVKPERVAISLVLKQL